MTSPALIERITRSLAYMLRHQPEEFDLELDAHGYGTVDEVVRALNERLGEPVSLEDVEIAIASGDRPRYELREGKLRALYGHSIDVEPGESTKPPELLFVGISSRDAERALRFGLRGGRRRFLHLALTPEDAKESGRRTGRDYVVITVYALDAWEEGINFYDRQALFLAEEIPTQFLELTETCHDGFDRPPHGESSGRPAFGARPSREGGRGDWRERGPREPRHAGPDRERSDRGPAGAPGPREWSPAAADPETASVASRAWSPSVEPESEGQGEVAAGGEAPADPHFQLAEHRSGEHGGPRDERGGRRRRRGGRRHEGRGGDRGDSRPPGETPRGEAGGPGAFGGDRGAPRAGTREGFEHREARAGHEHREPFHAERRPPEERFPSERPRERGFQRPDREGRDPRDVRERDPQRASAPRGPSPVERDAHRGGGDGPRHGAPPASSHSSPTQSRSTHSGPSEFVPGDFGSGIFEEEVPKRAPRPPPAEPKPAPPRERAPERERKEPEGGTPFGAGV
jgi:putative RNA 2'-phosphotransferase